LGNVHTGMPALERSRVALSQRAEMQEFRDRYESLTPRERDVMGLVANGENPKVVQELLRHASLKVTTDVYMQAVGPQKREAQGNLVKLVRKGLDSEAKSG